MSYGVFDGLWRFGQRMRAFDANSSGGRNFYGFIEPMSLSLVDSETRGRTGVSPQEQFWLIAEPSETFSGGTSTTIVCGSERFELLSVKEVFAGQRVSHRECVLLKVGEVDSGA